jgi:TRAP transporter TAXI family solute receptor
MAKFDRASRSRALGGLALVALLLFGARAGAAELVLATGGEVSSSQTIAEALCRLYNDSRPGPTSLCKTKTSDGSVANIQALRAVSVQLALVQADVAVAAARGGAPFGGQQPFSALRVLLALQPELFTVMARREAGIARFTDLKGRRVAVGPRGAGGRATLGKVMQYFGGREDRDFASAIELPLAQAGKALCAGRVDAIVDVVAHPNPLLQDTARDCSTRLVVVAGPQVEHLLRRYPVYRAASIPGRLYPGSATPTQTLGTRVLLLATDALDAKVAGRIVKLALDGIAALRKAHRALEDAGPSDLVPRSDSIEIHPGAGAAFRAAGVRE